MAYNILAYRILMLGSAQCCPKRSTQNIKVAVSARSGSATRQYHAGHPYFEYCYGMHTSVVLPEVQCSAAHNSYTLLLLYKIMIYIKMYVYVFICTVCNLNMFINKIVFIHFSSYASVAFLHRTAMFQVSGHSSASSAILPWVPCNAIHLRLLLGTKPLSTTPNGEGGGNFLLLSAMHTVLCRTAVTRALLGMQGSVTMDVLFYQRHPDGGWQFKPDAPGCTRDTVNGGIQFIRELYERLDSKEKSVSVYLTCIVRTQTLVDT